MVLDIRITAVKMMTYFESPHFYWQWKSFPSLFGTYLYQFSSVAQSCPTFWDPMDSNTPGFPVLHQLPELAQTHVHRVGDAIQPSHPLLSPSPPAFNLSQHQGRFQWVSSVQQVAKASTSVLPMNIQDWFPLGWTGLILIWLNYNFTLLSKSVKIIFINQYSI